MQYLSLCFIICILEIKADYEQIVKQSNNNKKNEATCGFTKSRIRKYCKTTYSSEFID